MAKVDVYLNSLFSGVLAKEGEQHIFSYDRDAGDLVSVTMPVRAQSYQYPNLHPIFQMNLPEGILKEAIERATAKHYGSDDLTMLTLLGNNQIGRLSYAREGQDYKRIEHEVPTLQELLTNKDATLFSQLLERYAMQSGVAGIQPKVLMDLPDGLIPNIDKKATLPLTGYIVKSWGPEYSELGCNEFVCLTLAREAGLKVADFSLSENAKLLVTKRFDIAEPIGNDDRQFLGFEDFCVLQGRGTREKYDASIESCANTIQQFVSAPYKKQALYDFFKLTLINCVIRNGDAHLKNIGILYPDPNRKPQHAANAHFECRMAPVFDLVSTVPYIPNDTMALSLTGSKRWPKWSVLKTFGKRHCQLSTKDIDCCVSEVEQARERALPLLNDLAKRHESFAPIADVMRELMKEGGFE